VSHVFVLPMLPMICRQLAAPEPVTAV
jgi:hypothetical protein